MTKFYKIQTLIISICMIILFASVYAESSISINIPIDNAYPFSRTVYGVNTEFITSMISFRFKDLSEKYSELGAQVVRYPAGTPANFYNFRTGRCDVPDASTMESFNKSTMIWNNRLDETKGNIGGFPSAHFGEFIKRTGTKTTIVLNIMTQTPEYTAAWMKDLKANGVTADFIEVGNEVYFSQYANAITDVRDYIQRAKAHAASVRKVFPKAVIAAVITSFSFTDSEFLDGKSYAAKTSRTKDWDKLLAKENFFDAVVIHLYGDIGVGPKTSHDMIPPYNVAYRNCMSHADFQFEKTIQYIRNTFPGKNIMVTEYHVGGFSENLRSYNFRSSFLGVLYTTGFFMKLIRTPGIICANYHSFSHMVELKTDKRGRISSEYEQDALVTKANYDGYRFFSEAIISTSTVVPVIINGSGNYTGAGKYSGEFPVMEGIALIERNNAYLYIINKFGTPAVVSSINFSPAAKIQIAAISQMIADGAITNEAVQIRKCPVTLPITVPGYSITKILLKY